jgi:hypothetical protein
MAISGVAHPQGGWPAAVLYPFRRPTPCAYVHFPVSSPPDLFVSATENQNWCQNFIAIRWLRKMTVFHGGSRKGPKTESTKFALWAATTQAPVRPAGGWPPAGHRLVGYA